MLKNLDSRKKRPYTAKLWDRKDTDLRDKNVKMHRLCKLCAYCVRQNAQALQAVCLLRAFGWRRCDGASNLGGEVGSKSLRRRRRGSSHHPRSTASWCKCTRCRQLGACRSDRWASSCSVRTGWTSAENKDIRAINRSSNVKVYLLNLTTSKVVLVCAWLVTTTLIAFAPFTLNENFSRLKTD